jgi:CRISPR-associated protein Cmr2
MTEDTPYFATAIAYCLAYDHWGKAPDREVLSRLLAGQEPRTNENLLLKQMLDLANFVLEELPTDITASEHLQHIQEKAQLLGDPRIALIMGGATKIKQYVFESAKLPEIRGASALLDRINLRDIPALFAREPQWLKQLCQKTEVDKEVILEAQQLMKQVRETFQTRYGIEPPDCKECVIYANGGEVLAFAPLRLAESLTEAIEGLYTRETIVANSVAVWRSCSLTELQFGLRPLEFWTAELNGLADESLKDLLQDYYGGLDKNSFLSRKKFGEVTAALAIEKLRRREGNIIRDRQPKSIPRLETNPYMRRCISCERRTAIVLRDDEQRWLCEPCARKSVFGQKAKREGAGQINWFNKVEFAWKPLCAKAWASIFDEWLELVQIQATFFAITCLRCSTYLQLK